MRVSTITYSCKQGIKNIWKNRLFSIASITTIAASIFIFSIFYLVFVNFQASIGSMQKAIGITVFFQENVEKEQIDKIMKQVSARQEVESVKYTSPEQAWEEYKSRFPEEERKLLSQFDDANLLKYSSSLLINMKDVSMQDTLVNVLENTDGVRKVQCSKAAADLIVNVGTFISYISLAVTVILLSVAVFLISNTVNTGIVVRKEEISIMKLIGATDFFIRAPFLIEGMILGCIGAAIPLGVVYYSYEKIVRYLNETFTDLNDVLTFIEPSQVLKTLVPVSVILGIVIGFFGSYLTVRKHLRRTTI